MTASATQLPVFGANDLGWLYIPFAIAVIVGATNAVNRPNGLDGLAAGSMIVAATPFMFFAYVCGRLIFARHLGVAYIAGVAVNLQWPAQQLLVAVLAFCGHNAHPARGIHGRYRFSGPRRNTGATDLCAAKQRFPWPSSERFVIEALSVILRMYFKMTKETCSSR